MALSDTQKSAIRHGIASGGTALAVLAIAGAPARVAGAYRLKQGFGGQISWLVAGLLRDLTAALYVLAPFILIIAAVVPLLFARVRRRWQQVGLMLAAIPAGLTVWIFGIAAQEMKAERGSYPTLFDLAAVSSSGVFLKGTVGFLLYDVYWLPALLFWLLGCALLYSRWRRPPGATLHPWRPWALGVVGSMLVAFGALRAFVVVTAESATVLGDPFQGIVDSAVDLYAYGKPATPRELVRDAALPTGLAVTGASLIGWPPHCTDPAHCPHHPHERSFSDSPSSDLRGRELVYSLEAISSKLFPLEDENLIVWQVTLESFRADDVHAINAHAPREIAPFFNGLYERAGTDGILASRATYQAGVRTAQGLGALACGLGTLPYNLSLIRDLQPFAVRCLADILKDAGFTGGFYYGSDGTFDGMDAFYRTHGIDTQVTQAELPTNLPKGAWDAVTDLALVDETTRRIKEAPPGSHYVMLTTLSNHSPFVPPGDLPPEVAERVEHALENTKNHADRDDKKRVNTWSYTDYAVAHFFDRLEELHLAERSVVVLSADHSTGENYLWGPEEGAETDDAKARIPFVMVLPKALRDRAADPAALDKAVRAAQDQVAAGALSQNDIPALALALVRSHSGIRGLPASAQWHTMGGQVTSPWFTPVARPGAYVMGINGVSEFVVLDRNGTRIGQPEDSTFLKTRGDRTVVTPSLVPITAALAPLLH